MIREEIKKTVYALATKEKWLDYVHTIRELQTEKRVFQIIEEYVGYDEETFYKLENTKTGQTKEFSKNDFINEKDNLSRIEYSANVQNVKIEESLIDTGNCQEIRDGDKIYKRNIVAVKSRMVFIKI